jgi:hypothetical protein
MAHARTIQADSGSRTDPSLLRLTLVALVLALAFDAVSTALAWDVVRALPGTVRRSPIHAVHTANGKDASRPVDSDAPDSSDALAH